VGEGALVYAHANGKDAGEALDSVGEKLPLVPGLVKKISKGGKGEWNEYIPMAPTDLKGARQVEITNIVNFILSIPPKK